MIGELRPLSIGEIFDRAVTLYIRNFVPFLAIVLVLLVPDATLGFFALGDRRNQLATYALEGRVILVYTLWPFVLSAVAVGVARLYRNRPVEFGACYAPVLRHWLRIVGMMFAQVLVFLGWFAAAGVTYAIIVFAASVIQGKFGPSPFWFGLGTAAEAVVWLPLLVLVLLQANFSMNAVVIEDRTIGEALSLSYDRIINRAEFWRALLFAIAVYAVYFGGLMVVGTLARGAAFIRQPALEVAIQLISEIALAPFAVVLLAVYYFDVRIRHEGYDLEARLDLLVGAPAT